MESGYGKDPTNDPINQLNEAKMIQKICRESPNRFVGYIAQIDVSRGAEYVRNFLNQLRDEEGKLDPFLKGGRRVWFGQPVDIFQTKDYIEGLDVLYENGLTWDICATEEYWNNLNILIKRMPHMKFCLNHLGLNNYGQMRNYVNH